MTTLTFAQYQAIEPYVTVAEADDFFGGRLYSDAWTGATEIDREKALYMATMRIDSQNLNGRKADTAQTLEFPRALYSSFLGGWKAETEISQQVKSAVCEEALSILSAGADAHTRAQLQRQGVTSFSLGKLSESFNGGHKGDGLQSPVAAQLLARYLGGGRVIV